MTRPHLLRAAAVTLLSLGITTLGVQAAFADETVSAEASAEVAPAAPVTEPNAVATPQEGTSVEAAVETVAVESETAAPDVSSSELAGSEVVEDAASTEAGNDTGAAAVDTEVDPTPYKLIAWSLPCGVQDPFCAPGQTLVQVIDLAQPTLDALDEELVGSCGDFQLDLYNDSPTTADLIAAGVLTAANHPTEDFAYGVLPDGDSPYKLVDNEDCAVGGSVVPIAIATPQTCTVNSQLLNGDIQVAILPGVTYTITGPTGSVAFDSATGLTGRVAPGAYAVNYTLDPTFTSTVPNPIPVSVAAFSATCAVPTPPSTVPPTTVPPTTTTTVPPTTTTTVGTVGSAVLGDPTQLTTLALTGSDPFGLASVAIGLVLSGTLLMILRAARGRFARMGTTTSR